MVSSGLIDIVKRDIAQANASVLEKRGSGGLAAALPFMPSLGWSGALAIGATGLVTAIYLHNIHEAKQQALVADYNSKYHSAGEAASSVGNAISTGANGQLFNPLTGNLILVDPNSNLYYDSGTGEQVNPKTGMPFKYGGGDDAKPAKEVPQKLPIDTDGNVQGDSPEVQQAMRQWNAMTPQQQQQLMNRYGGVAQQILSSPDPNAALQAWSSQQGQTGPLASQQQQASDGVGASSGLADPASGSAL